MEIVSQRPYLVRLRVTYERPLLAPCDLLWSYLQLLGNAIAHAWHPAQRTAKVNERYFGVMRSIARSITALQCDAKHGWPAVKQLTPEEVAGASRARLYQGLAKSLRSTHPIVAGLIRQGQLDPDALTLSSKGPKGADALPELGIAEGLRRVAVMLETLGRDPKSLAYLRFEHDSYRNSANLIWEPYLGWEDTLRGLLQPLGSATANRFSPDADLGRPAGQVQLGGAR